MNRDDVVFLESLLGQWMTTLGSLLRDTQLALDVLARRRDGRVPRRNPTACDLVDDGRFTVRWRGRECRLGNTVLFRLFRCLACSRNRYVSHQELLDEVWGGDRSASAVRTAVSQLRRRLAAAGMGDLARALDGSSPGHYGLLVDLAAAEHGSDGERTQGGR